MGLGVRFILAGAKRVFDRRPMYAQIVVTDDCNLSCGYCDEYATGAQDVPLAKLKARIDQLDALGVLVYDFLGGETLLHPHIAEVVRHAKSKRGGSNLATIITNGFLLTRENIRSLNAAGLDFMQVSVDSIDPTQASQKSLKSVLPRLRLLAGEARFTVEVQTVLNERTAADYDRFRDLVKDLPFAFGFSIMHGPGGRIAIRGEKYLDILSRYGIFDGVDFYGAHLREMLRGDFSRPWKCLAGFKFLYVTASGELQRCAQQRLVRYPLADATLETLKRSDRHKPCEPGCAIGCARMVSHTLGEPFQTFGASLKLALGMGAARKASAARADVQEPVLTEG